MLADEQKELYIPLPLRREIGSFKVIAFYVTTMAASQTATKAATRTYEYDLENVEGMTELVGRMKDAETVRDWSFILGDYLSFGNTKISDSVAIFNMNSATDCPNAETENCQVPYEQCYAHKAEKMYKQTLPYRRRQEYLWDCLDADTFAEAFLMVIGRKRKRVDTIRLSEAGDFRHNGDIYKAERIAELVEPEGISVYTYSASNYLDWDFAETLTVNQSNNFSEYGDRLYTAVPTAEDIPEDAVQCIYEKSDGNIKCGDCRMCIDKKAPDVYITLH